MPGGMTDYIAYKMPDAMEDRMPDKAWDRMPENISNRMADKRPESQCQINCQKICKTKCRNICKLVATIGSKTILDHFWELYMLCVPQNDKNYRIFASCCCLTPLMISLKYHFCSLSTASLEWSESENPKKKIHWYSHEILGGSMGFLVPSGKLTVRPWQSSGLED